MKAKELGTGAGPRFNYFVTEYIFVFDFFFFLFRLHSFMCVTKFCKCAQIVKKKKKKSYERGNV